MKVPGFLTQGTPYIVDIKHSRTGRPRPLRPLRLEAPGLLRPFRLGVGLVLAPPYPTSTPAAAAVCAAARAPAATSYWCAARAPAYPQGDGKHANVASISLNCAAAGVHGGRLDGGVPSGPGLSVSAALTRGSTVLYFHLVALLPIQLLPAPLHARRPGEVFRLFS